MLRLKMSVGILTHSWIFYAAIGILLSSVGAYIYITSGAKAEKAAQDVWETVQRKNMRDSFPQFSEEKISSMVERARKDTFGEKKK